MANCYGEDGLVNWKNIVLVMAGAAAATLIIVSLPIAAQIPQAGAPGIPAIPVSPGHVGNCEGSARLACGPYQDQYLESAG